MSRRDPKGRSVSALSYLSASEMKEQARVLYEREKQKETMAAKIKAKYLSKAQGDDYDELVTTEVNKLLNRGSVSVSEVKQLGQAVESYRQTIQANSQRPVSVHSRPISQGSNRSRQEENQPQDHFKSHNSSRLPSREGVRTPNERSFSRLPYDWASVGMMQVESEVQEIRQERERRLQKQLETRASLDRQIHERRSKMGYDTFQERSISVLGVNDSQKWQEEQLIEEQKRRQKEKEHAEFLLKQMEMKRIQDSHKLEKGREQEILDMISMQEEIEMGRILDRQKREAVKEEIKKDLRDSVVNRERKKESEINQLERIKVDNLDVGDQIARMQEEKRMHYARAIESRERRQQSLAHHVREHSRKMKHDEERYVMEQQRKLDELRQKEELMRQKSQQERLAIQQALLRQMEEKRIKKVTDHFVARLL
eukprot:TRINITY_DN2043_c0_g1_i4.p1 TRINITY_DN2043_c0_g1~~TRINITY_DN2043_c0_g1_i4.p1  ORF type:complete len:426 (-),score=97.03 TRINITY_DN2043_c0_g1_i4:682-1959(-)